MRICDHAMPSKPAIILHPSGIRVSFSELEERSNRLVRHLRRAGLVPGDTIAILMENNEHIHVALWAARRSGLYYTTINTNLSAAEVAYIVSDCDAKALFGSRATRAVCEEVVASLSSEAPTVRLMADADVAGWEHYPQCVAKESSEPVPDECEGDLLQYSSGSTGRPKGIWRARTVPTAGQQPKRLTPVFEILGVGEDSVYLSPAPLYHTAPSMWSMCAQAVGATTVIMEKFEPAQALECMERYGVTHAQFVPTMFVRMLRLPDEVKSSFDTAHLQRVVHAAAPCPPDIKREMIEWWGPIIDEYYSSSEGAGISFIRAEDWLEHPGSVGKPLMGTPHILDEQGNELPAGDIGDIYYGGGYAFEYLNDAVKTAAARSPQGWVTVGDVGYLDGDGYLYLTDRRHHMIISGGVNIYPQEAENLLVSHPLVLDAAVFGIPDEVMGQSVMAVVQLVEPANGTGDVADELSKWLRDRLAHYKCPRTIRFHDQLPRTDAGKLYKQQLIDLYGSGQAGGRHDS